MLFRNKQMTSHVEGKLISHDFSRRNRFTVFQYVLSFKKQNKCNLE